MSAHTLRKKATKLSGKRANKFSGKKTATPARKKAAAPARRRTSSVLSGKRSVASARRMTAVSDTPTSEALNEFVTWVNETYQLQLPTLADFAPGTLLYEMWSLTVDVTKNPSPGVVARAKAQTSLIIVAKLSGIVYMDIRQSAIAGTSRLSSRR